MFNEKGSILDRHLMKRRIYSENRTIIIQHEYDTKRVYVK